MAFSDYGGYAFRNGILLTSNCDVSIFADGNIAAWGQLHKTPHGDLIPAVAEAHVMLGDGPVYLLLVKQGTFHIHVGECEVDPVQVSMFADMDLLPIQAMDGSIQGTFRVLGCSIDVRMYHDHIMGRILDMSTGAKWFGFSGYEVGKGFEDIPQTAALTKKVFEIYGSD